jgi:hypothetical protein
MNPSALLHFNRWFIRELINALLRPMFVRYRSEVGVGVVKSRYERLFWRMLDCCDCWPFCVEVDRCGFWILDEPSEPNYWDEQYAGGDQY